MKQHWKETASLIFCLIWNIVLKFYSLVAEIINQKCIWANWTLGFHFVHDRNCALNSHLIYELMRNESCWKACVFKIWFLILAGFSQLTQHKGVNIYLFELCIRLWNAKRNYIKNLAFFRCFTSIFLSNTHHYTIHNHYKTRMNIKIK